MIFEKHVKLFSSIIFPDFPRGVGFPKRFIANSLDKFIELAWRYHLDSPSFIDLYTNEIDKLWIDIDNKISTKSSYSSSKTLYNRLIDEFGIDKSDIFVVYTANKGYHIYILNKPFPIPRDEQKHMKIKSNLKMILNYVTQHISDADDPLFTDTNRLTRMPGVQRKIKTVPVCVDPTLLYSDDIHTFGDFFKQYNFNWSELVYSMNKYLKQHKNIIESDQYRRKNYYQLLLNKIENTEWKEIYEKNNYEVLKVAKENSASVRNINGKTGVAKAYDAVLKNVLNDRLYHAIHAPNPDNRDRVLFAKYLMLKGLSVEDVVSIARSLRWEDFDTSKTRYYATQIYKKYVIPELRK